MQTHGPGQKPDPASGSDPIVEAAVDAGGASPDAVPPEVISPEVIAPAPGSVVFGVSRQALARAAPVARLRRAGGDLTLEVAGDGLRVEAHNAEVAAGLRLACTQAPTLAPGERLTITLDPDLIQLLGEPRFVPDAGSAAGVDIVFALPRPGSASPVQGRLAGSTFEHTFPLAFAEPLPPMPEVAGNTLNVAELREVLALLDGYAVADPERILGSTVRLGPTAVWAHLQQVGRVLTGFSITGIDACLSGPAAKDLHALLRLFDPVQTHLAATDEHCVIVDADAWCRVVLELPGLPRALRLGTPVARLTLTSDAFVQTRTQILALEEISHDLIEVAIRSEPSAELAFTAILPAGEATARCPALAAQIWGADQGPCGEETLVPEPGFQEAEVKLIDDQEAGEGYTSSAQAGQDHRLEAPPAHDHADPEPGSAGGAFGPAAAAPPPALEPITVKATWLAKLAPARTSPSIELLIGPRGLCLVEVDGARRIETFVNAERSIAQD